MTITKMVKIGAAALLALLFIGGGVVAWQINAVRMGGAMHLESQRISDLVADILPPPEYIIEPYLEATLVMVDPTSVSAAVDRLGKLRAVYQERHAYWSAANLPAKIKVGIVEKSDAPAQQFWSILETRFLPAARAGDRAAMASSYRELQAAYEQHRVAIDALVVDAAAYQREVQGNAAWTGVAMAFILILLAVTVLGAVAAGSVLLIRRVIVPMATLSATTSAIANGATVAIPHTDRTDELGDIAHALERLAEGAAARRDADAARLAEQEAVNTVLGERLAALRRGDLTQTIDRFPSAFSALRDNFNEAVRALRAMVHAVHDSADAIGRGAGEIAVATDDLARRTEASAANLEETNAALQQVSARLQGTLDATNETRMRADEATRAVSEGRQTGEHAAASMDRVSQRANDIGSVIEGLDKIAFQTRVLAMNAAVEAGNAGEAGRGFAVVADLVSALALRAEDEAQRVRDLITETRDEVSVAADAVRRMDGSLLAIAGDVDAVHDHLVQLHEDSAQQSQAVGKIAAAMSMLDGTTQQNAAMVEQASAAARMLSSEVAILNTHAGAFAFDARPRDTRIVGDRLGDASATPQAAMPLMEVQ